MTISNGDMPAMPIQATDKLIEMVSTCESNSALDSYISTFGGLTKREHFAMAAMQGLTSSPLEAEKLSHAANKSLKVFVVEQAVAIADALLAELDKAVSNE